jgi:hypothetical protein
MQVLRCLLLYTLFLIFTFKGNSQSIEAVINPILPYQKSAVNLLIINTGDEGYFTFSSSIKSLKGVWLMEERGLIYLRKGSNFVTARDVDQYQLDFISNEFQDQFSVLQSIPPLSYNQCIQLTSMSEGQNVFEGCQIHSANDLLFVQPIYPSNDLMVSESRPNFSWIIPGYDNFPFEFKVKLVEFTGNSLKSLRRNIPVFDVSTKSNQLEYPFGANGLENGKQYAWEIEVLLNNDVVTVSQPLSFVSETVEILSDIPKEMSFVLINSIESNVELYALGDFRYKFLEVFSGNKLIGKLIDLESGKVIDLDYEIMTTIGENKFIIELDKIVYLKHNHNYSLILHSELEKKDYFLSIRYINPDYVK